MWHSRPQTPIKGAPFSTLPAHANTHTHTHSYSRTQLKVICENFIVITKVFACCFPPPAAAPLRLFLLFLLLLPLFLQLLLLVLLLLLFLLPPSIFPDTLKFTQNSFPQPLSTLHSIYLPPSSLLYFYSS